MSARIQVAVAFAAAVSIGVAFSQVKKSISITGRVVDATGAGIRDATVRLPSVGGIPGGGHQYPSLPEPTKTDQNGRFTFTEVLPYRYKLEIRASGFTPFSMAIDAREKKDIDAGDLRMAVSFSPLTVEVGREVPQSPSTKTVSISGRVKASGTKEVIKDAIVRLSVPDHSDTLERTYSHRDGKFIFPAVPAQTYRLEVEVPGFKIFRKSIDAGNGMDIEIGDLYVELGTIGDPVEVFPTKQKDR